MEVAIIGAGPIGLYFAGLCEKNKINYKLFEADSFIGGQLTHLYPEKVIYNIPGVEAITAADYIAYLSSKIDSSKIVLGKKINAIEELKQAYTHVITATGIGEWTPRKLRLSGEENCNVLYHLTDASALKGKKVIVFGGGNSALDWASQLSKASKVSLVHRRDEFRGDAATIENCDLDLYLSYIPEALTPITVTLKSVKTSELIELDYDYILVNFGHLINKTQFLDSDNVYYIGDSTNSKTLAEGINQAEELFNKLFGGANAEKKIINA
jgi:thioredoxin reductase (NADPH)